MNAEKNSIQAGCREKRAAFLFGTGIQEKDGPLGRENRFSDESIKGKRRTERNLGGKPSFQGTKPGKIRSMNAKAGFPGGSCLGVL